MRRGIAVLLGVAAFAYVAAAVMAQDEPPAPAAATGIKPAAEVKAEAAPKAEMKSEAAPKEEAGLLIGNKESMKVHRPGCKYAEKMSESKKVTFKTLEEAEAAGYKPCGVCKPGKTAAVGERGAEKAAPGAAAPAGEFCSTATGKTFHKPDCKWAKEISKKNIVWYKTREEAVAAGKTPCKICKP
jgi:hypothetical protein